MLALGIILAVLIFLALVRVGVRAEYSEEGILIQLKIAAFFFTVYPREKKEKKRDKKKEKKPKGKKTAEAAAGDKPKEKKGGTAELIKKLLPEAVKALKKFKRKICIKTLKIYYTAASPDPAKTALSFGYASAGAGAISAVFENNFKVCRRDIRTSFSFTETKPKVYADLILTLAVWEILYIAMPFAFRTLKLLVGSANSKAQQGKED